MDCMGREDIPNTTCGPRILEGYKTTVVSGIILHVSAFSDRYMRFNPWAYYFKGENLNS